MATPEEIREQVSNDALEGIAEVQIGDRRYRMLSPAERLEAAKNVAASGKSPFIKVGFASRSI